MLPHGMFCVNYLILIFATTGFHRQKKHHLFWAFGYFVKCIFCCVVLKVIRASNSRTSNLHVQKRIAMQSRKPVCHKLYIKTKIWIMSSSDRYDDIWYYRQIHGWLTLSFFKYCFGWSNYIFPVSFPRNKYLNSDGSSMAHCPVSIILTAFWW